MKKVLFLPAFIHIALPILTGVGIYTMKYYQKNIFQSNDTHLPEFIYYQIPDFLWMYASMNSLWLIWKENSRQLMFYQISMLSIACALEVFQYFKYIPGTFDLKDIAIYFIAFIVSLITFKFTFKPSYHD